METSKHSFKDTKGKAPISLVPMDILTAIARVREYGVQKYGSGGIAGWKNVPVSDYFDALGRHFIEYVNNPDSVDKESGLPHHWHMACNIAFIIALEKESKEHV